MAFELCLKGNKLVIEFTKACIGLSMYQLFCDSFGIRCEQNERTAYLLARYAGKETRTEWTIAIAEWLDKTTVSENTRNFIYPTVSDKLNVAMTGYTSGHWKSVLKLSAKDLLRDQWNPKHLAMIERVEAVAAAQLRKGKPPVKAMDFALDALDIKVNPSPTKAQ